VSGKRLTYQAIDYGTAPAENGIMSAAHMEARIALKYSGPAVESGLMNVYDAAANMIALSEFVVAAAKIAYGDSVDAKAEVAGFARGSFVTDLVINFAPAALPLLSATHTEILSSKHLLTIVKGAFSIWKHLKGEKPKSLVEHGNNVSIENNNGQIINVQIESMNLTFSAQGAETVGKFIKDALSRAGMDAVEVSSKTETLTSVNQQEASYFQDVSPTENITDTIVRLGLVIEAPVFKDGNKWRFYDGLNSFHADIEDVEFMSRVNNGERFGKGDVLYADVRISQEQSGMKISARRSIAKVYEHRVAATQKSLFHDGISNDP
jgi:hypothetical protein